MSSSLPWTTPLHTPGCVDTLCRCTAFAALSLQRGRALPDRRGCFLGTAQAGKARQPCSLQRGDRGALRRLLGNVSPRVQLHTLVCQTKGDDQSRDGEKGGSKSSPGKRSVPPHQQVHSSLIPVFQGVQPSLPTPTPKWALFGEVGWCQTCEWAPTKPQGSCVPGGARFGHVATRDGWRDTRLLGCEWWLPRLWSCFVNTLASIRDRNGVK